MGRPDFRGGSRGSGGPRGGGDMGRKSFGGMDRGARNSFGGDDRGGRGGGRSSFGGMDRGGRNSFGGGGDRGGGRGGRGGRGGPGGRGGRGGGRGGFASRVIVEAHKFDGVFIHKDKGADTLVTRNRVQGESVYGEKRVTVNLEQDVKVEYRIWNPFRSKLAAGILNGLNNIHIQPGFKVLYLGAANGTTVSHVSDIVGDEGVVYAVEFSPRSGRDLLNVAKSRTNIVPIVEDARHPHKYRMLIMGCVDVIFADVAQPDQARIVALNAHSYLKDGGHSVVSIKASCVDSVASPEAIFAAEREQLAKEGFRPREQVSLDPYERGHAILVSQYRPKKKAAA